MAITKVRGTITRTFYQGKGAEITEEFTVADRVVKKRWAAWFNEPHGLTEGQTVELSGLHDDKIDEWDDKDTGDKKRAVKRSLNKAQIVKSKDEPAREHAHDQAAPAADSWSATAPSYGDSETPF
jgi:hypothetical protein